MIKLEIKGLAELRRKLDDLQKRQLPFAIAKTLTATAQTVRDAMPAQMERDLDRPKPFTKGAFYVRAATKNNLQAVVAAKPIAAQYLAKQVFGGVYEGERNDRLKLPSDISTDAFGNIPRGLVRQMVRRAMEGKRLTKMQGRRIGTSTKLDIFYGEPQGSPLGLYKRTRNGLVPLIVFPKEKATYRPRFKFFETARAVALRRVDSAFAEAWAYALRTAK